MARSLQAGEFARAYDEYVIGAPWHESPEYYPRYRSRYAAVVQTYARIAPPEPIDVLEIGGGQNAMLTKILWGDRAVVADVSASAFPYLNARGIETKVWNLCRDEQPFEARFDAVFLAEVIEHLPIPGHIALEKLRRALRPGGTLICTTPNLYRPRNVVYLALGIPIFDYFHYSENGLGHVLEYSKDHLLFQIEKAGFTDCRIELRHFPHSATRLPARFLASIGAVLYALPRFRDNLLATAVAP